MAERTYFEIILLLTPSLRISTEIKTILGLTPEMLAMNKDIKSQRLNKGKILHLLALGDS